MLVCDPVWIERDGGNVRLIGPMISTRHHGFTYDNLHFVCSVNREMLTLILNAICDPHELQGPHLGHASRGAAAGGTRESVGTSSTSAAT
jgi:hypothetical protein